MRGLTEINEGVVYTGHRTGVINYLTPLHASPWSALFSGNIIPDIYTAEGMPKR